VAGHPPQTAGHALYLLDLPGYGYARVSKLQRTAFANLVRHVLARPRLAGVVWLLDVRREPSAEDQAMLERFARAHTPVLAAITKSDKLPRGQRAIRVQALQAGLGLAEEQVVSTSARSGDGIADLRAAIAALAAAPRS
jgi:GTP-binding protein